MSGALSGTINSSVPVSLPFPETELVATIEHNKFPVIIKSREGCGSKDIHLINSKEDKLNYLDEFSEVLVQANDLVTKNNSKLYFVYVPVYPGTHDGIADTQKLESYKKVINLVKKLDIPIIDIHNKFFMKQTDPISFFAHRIYGHYGPEGYSEISKVIIKLYIRFLKFFISITNPNIRGGKIISKNEILIPHPKPTKKEKIKR